MKLYKSFVAFSLMAMAMMGCSTEDLEKDINALKDQVAKVEAQVQKLNDNMNVLRIALDGNKTIQEFTDNGDGSYKLLLSDGSTLVLTQGVAGKVYYPEVSIDGEGYWVIDGVKQDVKAKAEKGEDGITPKFQLKAEGGNQYWQVSYDDGKTYDFLMVDGQKVQANATESIKPSDNGLITDVKADGNSFSFKFDGITYTIPVVKGLKLIVKIDESQMENGVWIVPKGNTTQVDVDWGEAEYVLLSASEGWKVERVEGQSAIQVTIPDAEGAEGVITIQTNKGTSWAVEKVKVKAKHIVTSYLAEYNNGKKLNFGGVTIDKTSGLEVQNSGKVLKTGEKIGKSGIYFLQDGAQIIMDSRKYVDNYILLCDKPGGEATISIQKEGWFTVKPNAKFFMKNVSLVVDDNFTKNNIFDVAAGAGMEVVFDHCTISLGKKNLGASSTAATFEKLYIKNSKIFTDGNGTINNIIAFGNSTILDFVAHNNLIANLQKGAFVKGNLLKVAEAAVSVTNNTFNNYLATSGYVKTKLVNFADGTKWNCKNNLFNFADVDNANSSLISASPNTIFDSAEINYTPNISYFMDKGVVKLFHSDKDTVFPEGMDAQNIPGVEKSDEPILQVPTSLNSPLYLSLKPGFGYDPTVESPVLVE